jgi:transposase InsO family protein
MRLHANARTCPASRALICRRVTQEGWPVAAAATAAGISRRSAHKWLARYRSEGQAGLIDRPSRPHHSPHATSPERIAAVLALRGLQMVGPEIAEALAMARSTVAAILSRAGRGRLRPTHPTGPANRYERRHPGELLHIDIKRLGRIERPGHAVHGNRRTRVRGAGWEYVHVAIDDASRLAYAEVLTNEQAHTVVGFLERAVAHMASLGIAVSAVMTDNGPGYRSLTHAACCRRLGLRHLRTRPYTPRTNGKAERFIRTLTDGWAHRRIYRHSTERQAALGGWLHFYNRHRPHSGIGGLTPYTRLTALRENNVPGLHS